MEHKLHGAGTAVQLSDAVFGVAYQEPLVHQVVVAYQAGGRAGTKAQKLRSEVRGGGRKPWRQKGTGRARAGSIRSPLWVGGGKAFAARPRSFEQKVNRKMYRGALRSMLSELLRQERLLLVESFAVAEAKTREVVARLRELELTQVLIVVEGFDENLFLAARNLPHVHVLEATEVDPVSLLSSPYVVMTAAAAKRIEEWLS